MTEEVIHLDEKSFGLSDAVKAAGGIDVNWCYQCGKCASGCPMSDKMDLTPTQLIHAVQLGLEDLVYNSKTMWLCSSCQTCTTRCPQGVDIAEVLAAVKVVMQRKKKKSKLSAVLKFNKEFLRNVKWFGRTYELGMVAMFKLVTFNLTQDLSMGIKMLKKGKFSIFPRFKRAWTVRNIFRRSGKKDKA